MKESTKKLLDKIDTAHDWIEGQTHSGGGTEYHGTDTCQVCGLRRHWQEDRQNEIPFHYRFSTMAGQDLPAIQAVKCA